MTILSIVSIRRFSTSPIISGVKPFKIGVENLNPTAPESASSATIKESLKPTAAFGEEVKRYVLDNGLTLLIRENKDLPLVSIKVTFKGGLRVEDKASNGLCNLVVKMLDKGTKRRDAAEIAYFIESKGASISAFSGNNE